jgi:hypothetical protein
MTLAVADVADSVREIGARGTGDACRLRECGAQIVDGKLEGVTGSGLGEEIGPSPSGSASKMRVRSSRSSGVISAFGIVG